MMLYNKKKIFAIIMVMPMILGIFITNKLVDDESDNIAASSVITYSDIDVEKTVQLLNQSKTFLVDVRETNEYVSGHIENAVSLPFETIDNTTHFRNILRGGLDDAIIVYATNDTESIESCLKLIDQGYHNVYHLDEGIIGWVKAGYPISIPESINAVYDRVDFSLSIGMPVFLFFYEEWCAACQMQKPVIKELSENYAGRIDFVFANATRFSDLRENLDITDIPTSLLIYEIEKGHQVFQKFVGVTNKSEFTTSLDEILSGDFSNSYYPDESGSDQVTVYNVSSQEVKDVVDLGKYSIVFLDVSSDEEYVSAHVSGAVSLPLAEIDCQSCVTERVGTDHDMIFVYAHSGQDSLVACARLIGLGFTNVYNVYEGISGLRETGFSIDGLT